MQKILLFFLIILFHMVTIRTIKNTKQSKISRIYKKEYLPPEVRCVSGIKIKFFFVNKFFPKRWIQAKKYAWNSLLWEWKCQLTFTQKERRERHTKEGPTPHTRCHQSSTIHTFRATLSSFTLFSNLLSRVWVKENYALTISKDTYLNSGGTYLFMF